MRARATSLNVTVTALLVVTGCSSASQGTDATAAQVRLSVSQHRVDDGTDVANLRVINQEDRTVEVSAIGLESPAYEAVLLPHDSPVYPQGTVDMRLTLPAPDCARDPRPAYGVVEVDGVTVRRELEPAGQEFLESLWRRRCNDLAVAAAADVGFSWGSVRGDRLPGAVVVTRTPGSTAQVRVAGLQGSVLFELVDLRPRDPEPGATTTRSPVTLRPARCDEHALGETQQAFLFKVDVSLDGAAPVRVTREVAPEDRGRLLRFLRDAC